MDILTAIVTDILTVIPEASALALEGTVPLISIWTNSEVRSSNLCEIGVKKYVISRKLVIKTEFKIYLGSN